MSRIALLTLTALVAACLFSVALFAQTANADITPSLTASFLQNGTTTGVANPAPGSHYDYRQLTNITTSNGDDIQRLTIDYPSGMIGDPNAITSANRCNVDYTTVTSSSGSPSYAGCPASSKVGTIRAVASSGLTCSDITLNGSIYLLRNRPTANPEVPTYLGINLSGTANIWLLFCAGAGVNLNMTAKITLRPTDQGLRIQIIDDITKTDPIIGGAIQIKSIDQTISGMAPAPSTKPFLTAPTRCTTWDTKVYGRAYSSNGNVDTDIDPGIAGNDHKVSTSTTTPSCVAPATYNPTFTLTQTNTQAGRPVGLLAVLDNPVVTTNTLQPSYAKQFDLTLPVGMKINPAIANRLGSAGCTEAEFLMPGNGLPVQDTTPTCPAGSQVGTVAVKAPEVTGDLVGKIYLGDPRPGDEAAGIYRLYIFAARGGLAVKFQGTATANAGTGQVVVSITNASSYGSGLPQFNYSKFTMDFNTNSAGVGFDDLGNPVSNPVSSPSDAQQMLINPQVCGSYNASVAMTPWTSPNEAVVNTNKTLTVTSGTNGSCSFNSFAPTFSANLSNTQAGRHPDLNLTVTRGDRQDNIKNLLFKLPSGFAGSASAVPTCSGLSQSSLGTCTAANALGTAAVTVGLGPDTLVMPTSTIYNVATVDSSQTARLGIVTPAVVGPFDLGYVISYSVLRLDNTSTFRLTSSTDLTQSINGIPVAYRSISLTLSGMAGAVPFLQNPSATCASPLAFDATITSNGDLSGPTLPGSGSASAVVLSDTNQNLDCTTTPQPFTPAMSVTPTTLATAQPTGLTLTMTQSQAAATTQQSTIKNITVTMPNGLEINPGFASAVTACPTATINTDITNATDSCAGPATKIADVTVTTPLLGSAVTGKVYLEASGSTPATRYRVVMYLDMPGGKLIIRGSVTLNGSTTGGVAGSTGAVNSGTGQLIATFNNLPDVPYSSMALAFNSATPMFVNSDTIGSQTFGASFVPYSTSSTNPVTSSPSYLTNYNGTVGSTGTDPWAPTFSQTLSSTAPNAHPDLTLTVNRPEKNQQLSSIAFALPSGLTGAPAAVPTCTQVLADAANCPANSRVGSVTATVGSALVATPAAGLATLSGSLYNTVAPATAPAKLTAVVPIVLGPFNLGSMTLPVDVALRPGSDADPYGLTASVTLPNRYEGVKIRYRSLQVLINGVAPGNGANFLTNPSNCGASKTTTATMTSALSNVATATQNFTVGACAGGFAVAPTTTVATNPATPATQTPVGLGVTVTNATGNSTMKQLKLTFPSGMSVNPAVGNYPAGFTCPTATINSSAGGADACSAAGKQVVGTVSMTTPLISGTFTGNVYLETPDPSGSPDTRFRLAMIVALPGQSLIIRGKVRINGDTTVPVGATGNVDSGTGIITADFDNLPDLSFNNLTVNLATGSKALLVTPTACSATNTITAQMYPYNNPTSATSNNSNFNTNSPCVATSFNPTFSATVSDTNANANPNLTMTVTNPGATVDFLRSVTYHLPTGFVANTNNVARCSQANATAGTCATPAVGTASAAVGTNAEQYTLNGSVYNVTPNASEPARLQAIIPVTVGPFNLGNLSVPVTTSLRADYGIDATAQLPQRYEGIDIRARSLTVTLSGTVSGQPFFENPSVCQTVSNFNADISNGVTPQNKVATSFAINGCPKVFGTDPTLTVTPSTTQAADPVGLTFNIGSAASNPTMKRVQLDFPTGMEINPAFANGLTPCTTPTVAGCASANSIATVSLTTPLLSTSPLSGNVYIVAPGTTAATRYKVVMIVDLPGSNELIVQGAVTVNGSTDVTSGGTGSIDTGTGKIYADFNNIPDLGFTALTMTFNSGTRAMVVNRETNATQTFTGTFTNNANGADKVANASYATTGASTAFNPSFTASASSYVANAHPTLTMNIARADKSKQLKNLAIHLPAGLTANTGSVPQCTQASATAATCATTQPTSQVGTIPSTTIGSGTETYNVTGGKIFAVVPNATEPARFQAIIPVVVGPYNLGNLSVPISGSLRSSDYGIDLATTLPTRYEGIAVRIQTMQMIINGTVNSQNYMNNPSKCTAGTISADFTAADATPDSSTANNSSAYTATGCPVAFGTSPTVTVSGMSTTTQTPTGMTVAINSAVGNPSIGAVQLTMPSGMSLNPAVGNNGNNTTCATAVIDAITPSTDACPAAAQQGTVSLTSPLLNGTFTGKLYLESPGTTASTRYKLAIVVSLPGQMLIVHGGATVNGSTTIPTGGTGAKDSGTGDIVATFPTIPDLAFSNLTLTLATSNRSMLITPSTCAGNWTVGTSVSPNGGGAAVNGTQNTTPTSPCPQAFNPTFSGTVTSYAAGAHPDLNIAITNGGSSVNTIRNLNVKLPVGLVANTTAVARCSQADATAGTCGTTTPSSAVGTITTTMGASAEQLSLTGTVYNVVPSAAEPAHLAALIPVVVGPFDLGNLPVDISTALNDGVADSTRTYGVDTFSTLPTKYEGIDVRVRSINLTVNGTVSGQPFMINPSACSTGTIGADIISPDPTTVSRTTPATFTGCNRAYATDPTLTVTPSTMAAGQPVGLQFDLGTTLLNPTTQGIKINFPTGFELNPAAGTGLDYCSAANLATTPGQTICDGNGSRIGTVTLTTPLLSNPQTGAVYLEQPGTTATTRYKAAIVVKLPSKDLILHGSITLNGSTTIPSGGTGAVDSGTGQITADFPGIPDLGFSNMRVAFNSGSNALFVNPEACSLATFSADWTPHGTGAVKTVTGGYTPDTNCAAQPFAPTFNGSVAPTTSAGNPNVTLNFVRPDNNRDLRNITVGLPTGLVAATSATSLCSQATAAAGNCAANQAVGTVATSIGSGASTFSLSGSLYNVAANATEPARFAAVLPVVVGPFDLGKLSIPVPTTLRSDLGVDATAQLPTRYEGIAVRIRTMQLVLSSTANGNPFMINPSKCQSNPINASMVSDGGSPATVASSFSYTTTGCTGFGTAPSLSVSSSSSVPADPAGLTFTINSAASNPTMKRVQITFPSGMEINPAFGTGLTACATATIDAGGSGCAASSQLATVSMVTPLLNSNPTGKVYLETPGTTSTTRYKVAMVIDLPGQKLIVRGAIQINGSSTIPSGATGAVDTGTGQISADFDNIPDLGFTSLSMAFASGPNALVVNPETCANSFSATFTPNSNTGATSNTSPSYPLTGCGTFGFDPGFTATVDNTTPGGHPNLGLNVTRSDKQKTLKTMAIHLPTGLVANTSAVASPCSQASAAAGTCATTAAAAQVGTFSTSIGSGSSTYSLTGGQIFQVTPNSNEPVRFAAIVPVVVGPFDLGKLTIPVTSSIRADYGIDANATLPQRYEGIAVRIRTLNMTLNSTVGGNNYVTNPSKCQSNTISADFTAGDSSTDSSSANNSSSFTTAGCSATVPAYNPTMSAAVNPTTAGAPTALTLGVQVPAGNATTSRVQVALPQGMEINPGVGNGLVACSTIDSDPSSSNPCKLTTSNLATVTLNTPLLPSPVTGEVYLETPGSTATTRYKLALVLHLPGKDIVIHGGTLVNGSTTIAPGGLGSTDAAGTATGQVTADFPGIPDLGFTNMSLAFNSGSKLFVNPKNAATHTVQGTLTPHSVATTKSANATFTTAGGTSAITGWNPTFSASISPSTSAANPNLTLNVGNPLGTQELKSFGIQLPVGLVANTTAVPRCSQANADAATCLASQLVGTVSTTFGSSDTVGEDYTVNGTIYNVIPNADQPARLQAIVPVQVGPFDLGKLSIPVPTTLNSDLTVTASASLPSRYEGIAVRVRAMQMVIQGQPNGNKFMVAPTKCGSSNITGTLVSDTSNSSTLSSAINITGCPTNFSASPTLAVTPDTTTRTSPVNLTFGLTSSANNPTIGRVQVAMPVGMEINPGFANNLTACASASIDAGGSSCPVASQIGTVSLKTQLLDPTTAYTGKVYLETPGTTAATRYKIAMVVDLPGAKLIVRGKVAINGSSDITGGTGATDSGTGQITADFDTIPDLGFTELNMAFSSTNPMLINPQTCSSNTFTATVTPSSNGTNATPTAAYSTTPAGCGDAFGPNFSVNVDGSGSTSAGGHPNLNIHVDRPNGTPGSNQRYLRQLNLDLPIGLVAATTATTHCTQANALAGNCTSDNQVGSFDTFIGNGAADANNLELAGQIYNVDPNPGEPARLAAITDVQVGPYNLGKLMIPIGTQLNSDLSVSTTTTIPRRYEGIAVRIKKLDIALDGVAQSTGKPFISVPSKCQNNTVTANMTSDTGTTASRTSSFTTTGCPRNFVVAPTVGVTSTPNDTTVPTGLGVTIGSDPQNSTISRFQLALPNDMSINADAGNGLATCSTAQINAGGSGCPASSNQGTVTLTTPLLGANQTGNVYLEDPGSTGATRYKLAIVVHLPGTDMILRGKVLVNGSSDITGGLGATDTGTGRITTDFDTIPDLQFTQMVINFNTGNRALLTNPDSCGTQTTNSTITPSSGGSDALVDSTFNLTNTLGCSASKPFDPTFSITQGSTTSGGNTDLTLKVTAGAKNEYLRNFNVKLPVGLVADTTATDTTCSQAQAAAATCTAASQVGTVTTKLGTGAETLDIDGGIYNVVPNSDEPARLAAIVPVVVGPYNLGKLTIPVPTSLRGSDYGVDASAQLPTKYEGINVRLAEMSMTLNGVADQGNGPGADDKGFIKNPSKCDLVGDTNPMKADLVPLSGSTVTRTVNYIVDGCPRDFSPNPTLTVSNTTGQTAVPTGMTLQFDSAASNPTIGSVVTTMPLGMTLNPAVANLNGGINVCSTDAINAIKANPNAPACPAASKVGDVSLITPLLPGTKTGSIYLEEPGNTASTRYRLVMIVDLPGTKLVVRGSTTVDGSSDIPTNSTSATGATNSGTGQIVATFAEIPDLGFTQLKIEFSSGPDALFTNSETEGTQTVSAEITPQSGGSTITSDGTYNAVYGGSGSQASEPFNPTFGATFSTLDAAANPDVTITVDRADYTQQIEEFDLHLPPGLVANTVLTPRCSQTDAVNGACQDDSVVGAVTTKIGTGADTLTMTGKLYNVIPDANEPARLAVVIPVQVGPYNLGKLSLPVTTQIVSGAQASDLSIDTHTVLPKTYEGVPVRVRQLQIQLKGMADQGTPSTADDKPFMINPSQCTSHTLTSTMKSTIGNSVTVGSPGGDFTTVNCANAPYNPAITASLSTTQRGKPVGLDLGFQFSGNSSSTKKIVTTFPSGMSINPGVGNYGAGMTCADADVEAGGTLCPSSSKLGTVELDTPLLPTTQTGALYLLPPVGNQAATRYRLGLFVDLPGAGDLYTTGSVTVAGSSDVTGGGTGAVDTGDGQVVATFDNLPDLQFNNLTLHFKTTGAGEHALLTNPNTCGTFNITADMSPWARPLTSEQASTSFTTTDSVASCIQTESADQLGYIAAEIGEGPDFNNPAGPAYYAGSSQPVTLTVNRPDSDKSIKRVKILLPPGLVGSADAAPTCAQASADAGTCDTTVSNNASQIGTVTLQIGDSSDTYEITGGLYNTVAPGNRPAKFTFIADVTVGPFAFGKVIVPIDVNMDNNDYSLFAETGDMPQVFEGIPVRISQMKIALVGTADQGTVSTADDKIFMSNPRSCASTLHVRAVVTSAPGNTTKDADAPLAGPFTNCGNLNLNANTVTIENEPVAPETGHGAEHPTGLNVEVHQNEALPTQATLKAMTLDLPGFRLSAPAANGLSACSKTDLDNQACPGVWNEDPDGDDQVAPNEGDECTAQHDPRCSISSMVGNAWIDTSLLPKDQVDPGYLATNNGNPAGYTGDLHSLWGKVYLETPGTAADGSDRYKLAIQLSGKTLITIRGTAIVNESDNTPIPGKVAGEITTTFEDLPDIPFTDFRVDLTGYRNVTGPVGNKTTTYFPLLLNPEGTVGSASTSVGNANLTPHSGTPAVDRTSNLPVDPAPTKTFAPTATSSISPLTSGGHPNANFVIARGDAQEDIKNVAMQLPAGFLGSAAAVPLCPVATATAGNCNDQSKVGTVTAKIGQYGQTLTLPGKVYLTEGVGGDIAGMSIKVPAKAGPYDLGDYITQGRIQIRPSDHGITVNFVDVPKMFKGVPTHIQNMDITLPGRAQSTDKPFLYNASDCSAFNIVTSLTPYSGSVVSDSDGYQATGCAARAFSPTIAFAATSGGDDRTAPSWQIKMHSEAGDSTLKSTTVVLPSVMTVNVQGIGDACPADQVTARTCPATSKIGTVSVDTPLLSTPVTGTIYMAKSVTGQSLPDMLIDIPAPIDMQIRGANSFVTAGNAASQIKSTFTNLPDLIWTDMTMNITGGTKGILGLRTNGLCGAAASTFASHSGQSMSTSSPVTGISGFCNGIGETCANPTVKVSTKGAKKKGYKKASTSLSLSTASNCKAIKAVRVTYPKGTKLNKKLIVFNKKKKATKKNLKNVTGKVGSKSLTSKDFAVSGSNGLKFNTVFPTGTRSFSINTKNSALVPSFKTFCGDITKKKYKVAKKYKAALKKCQSKKVTFTFEITNDDGSAFRYNYTVPAGSKFFK
ncbi:MAG: hypothetical protein JHC98_01530 [Thermoleophilaceae bacterium]|nr:hypothetical protein [Thermoleophilaceae bacterium]